MTDGPPDLPDHDSTMISPLRVFEPSARRAATVVVVQGRDLGRHFALRRNRVVLGRGGTADVVLQDKEISRAHAAIEGVRLGAEVLYRLVDLGSTNHLYVNGRQVESHVLVDGDKIALGD